MKDFSVKYMLDFRILPWCIWAIHSSGMLHSVDW